MSKAFDQIMLGLNEALDHSRGLPTKVKIHQASAAYIKVVRTKLGLSQAEFARRYGFTIWQIRNWEQGRSAPTSRAAILYLAIIERNPEQIAVMVDLLNLPREPAPKVKSIRT